MQLRMWHEYQNLYKNENCHNLLTLKLFKTCMSFFLLLNTKEGILMNVGMFEEYYSFNSMEDNGYQQLFGYQHSSEHLILCST